MRVTRSTLAANNIVGTGVGVTQVTFFDPSGLYSNVDGSYPSGAMDDWSSFIAIYDQYKVTKIKMTYNLIQPTGVPFNTEHIVLYARYNYDSDFVATTTTMSQLTNCKQFVFTQEEPSVSFKIYPRVDVLVFNRSNNLATEGCHISKMRWTDVHKTTRILGFAHVIPNLPTGWEIAVTCEYTVAFKYQR